VAVVGGIRRCDSEKELRQNYQRVISEATKAFGSAEVFVEKCIIEPRYIEVQIMADSHGNVVEPVSKFFCSCLGWYRYCSTDSSVGLLSPAEARAELVAEEHKIRAANTELNLIMFGALR